jgi:N4-gp56 family major capsid protein
MTLSNFIPSIWANEIARNLEKFLVYAQPGVVNRDYEGEISGAGSTVKINGIGPITIGDYTKNTNIGDPETLTDSQTTLLINQQKYFNFQVDDIDKAQTKPKVMANAMLRAGYGMRDAIDQYIASLYTDAAAANLVGSDGTPKVPNNTAADASNVYNLIVDCAVTLTNSKVPTEGRWMIVPPWFYGKLLKEDKFVKANEAGTDNALRNGIAGKAAGFTILQSHNVPYTTVTTKYKIMFGVADALTYANQITQVEGYRPQLRFADAVKGLNIFGAKVVYPEMLGVLTCNTA